MTETLSYILLHLRVLYLKQCIWNISLSFQDMQNATTSTSGNQCATNENQCDHKFLRIIQRQIHSASSRHASLNLQFPVVGRGKFVTSDKKTWENHIQVIPSSEQVLAARREITKHKFPYVTFTLWADRTKSQQSFSMKDLIVLSKFMKLREMPT